MLLKGMASVAEVEWKQEPILSSKPFFQKGLGVEESKQKSGKSSIFEKKSIKCTHFLLCLQQDKLPFLVIIYVTSVFSQKPLCDTGIL